MEDGNPDAAYLLVGGGCELPDAVARQYGLHDSQQTALAQEAIDAKAIESTPENKAILFPPENKRTKKTSK